MSSECVRIDYVLIIHKCSLSPLHQLRDTARLQEQIETIQYESISKAWAIYVILVVLKVILNRNLENDW